MNELVTANDIPSMAPEDEAVMLNVLDKVRELEADAPCEVPTDHFVHAGCYARTCLLKKGGCLVGAKIKVPTVVIVSGDCIVNAGAKAIHINGYHVFKGGENRRQCFIANEDTYITMIFGTDLTDLGKCEEAFTDEFNDLLSRR